MTHYRSVHALTGSVIQTPSLYTHMVTHGFLHTLWLTENEFEFLRNSYLLEERNIILCYQGPSLIFQANRCEKPVRYINIQQVSHPWVVFEYYLYHRQFREDGTVFSIKNQMKAHEALKKYRFRENYWVTESFFHHIDSRPTDFPQKYTPVRFLSDRETNIRTNIFYNIGEFKSAEKLKMMIQNRVYSTLKAHIYPSYISNQLVEAMVHRGYQSRLWFLSTERDFVHRLDVKLKDNEIPYIVRDDRKSHHLLYNIEQTTDPLRLQKSFCESRFIRSTCVDVLSKEPLPLRMAREAIRWKQGRSLASRFWVKQGDLLFINAIVKNDSESDGFHFGGDVYFNFDQIENPMDTWKNIDALRLEFDRDDSSGSALEVLNKILAG